MENEDTNTKKIHIATRCDSVKNMSERNVAHNKRSDIIKWRVVNERVGVERQIADWPIDVAFFVYVMNIVLKKSQKVVTNHLENCLKFLAIKHFYGFALIVCRNVDALDLISITLKKRAHKNVIVCEPWKVVSFSHSSTNAVYINRSGMIHKILSNFLLFFIIILIEYQWRWLWFQTPE